MTTRRIALAAILLSLATLFCTLRSSGAPGGQSGPIDDGERIATLDAISEVVETSTLPDGEVDRAALLKYFESNPAFELSGEAPDGSVWARFTDGRLVIIPASVAEAPDEAATTPSPASDLLPPYGEPLTGDTTVSLEHARGGRAVYSLRQQGAGFNLPMSDTAIVMDSLGAGFAHPGAKINSWLKQNHYSSSTPEPSVDELKKVRDVGVFYISTHGGQGCLGEFEACQAVQTPGATPTSRTEYTYALWTTTSVTAEDDIIYKADLDGKYLAYMLAEPSEDQAGVWRYAITGKFVAEKMSFSTDSLVFIDACSSMGSTLPSDLKEAGASVVVGWTASTSSKDRPAYFFDRMLGINKSPYTGFPKKPDPDNRPFDVDSVMRAMNKARASTIVGVGGKGGSTTLVATRLQGSFSILRPTIERLVVNEENSELEIYGVWGDSWGKVTIGGTEVAVKGEWNSKKLVVELPDADQSGGKGNVIVRVRDHESNAVPLTLWHVKFTYTEGPQQTVTAYQHLYLDVYWRADVHRYRDLPDDTSFHEQKPFFIEPADSSSGSWDCDWHGSYAGLSFTTVTGAGDLPFNRKVGTNGWTSAAQLDPGDHTISHLEFEMNFDPETICVVKSEGYGVSSTGGLGFVLLPSLLDEILPDAPVTEPLKLDGQWMLVGANRDLMHDGKWPYLKWEDTKPEPKTAPDPKKTEA